MVEQSLSSNDAVHLLTKGVILVTCAMADPGFAEGGCANSQKCYYYRPQRSWGKVMFLHVSVILFTGGSRSLSMGGLCPGGGLCQGVSLSGRGLCHGDPTYGNEQAVRILLECILIVQIFFVENCMKMKEFRPRGACPWCPPPPWIRKW